MQLRYMIHINCHCRKRSYRCEAKPNKFYLILKFHYIAQNTLDSCNEFIETFVFFFSVDDLYSFHIVLSLYVAVYSSVWQPSVTSGSLTPTACRIWQLWETGSLNMLPGTKGRFGLVLSFFVWYAVLSIQRVLVSWNEYYLWRGDEREKRRWSCATNYQ